MIEEITYGITFAFLGLFASLAYRNERLRQAESKKIRIPVKIKKRFHL